VASAFIVAERAEILLSVGVILLVVLAIFLVARRRKPDPKMALLLSLVEAMPRDTEDHESPEALHEEDGGKEGTGPLGPSEFTLSA